MSSYYRKQLEVWLSNIEVEGEDVLDIGGLQLPLSEKRLKKFRPRDYVIADIEQGADVRMNLNNPLCFAKVFKFRKEKFDTIFCLEVFEYIYNPIQAIMNIADYIKEGGTAYISFPFSYPLHNPEGTDMLRYTENWIKIVMKAYGFTDIEITARNDISNLLQQFYSVNRMKCQKNIDHSVVGYMVKGIRS